MSKIYINGQEVAGQYSVNGDTLMLTNIGYFAPEEIHTVQVDMFFCTQTFKEIEFKKFDKFDHFFLYKVRETTKRFKPKVCMECNAPINAFTLYGAMCNKLGLNTKEFAQLYNSDLVYFKCCSCFNPKGV